MTKMKTVLVVFAALSLAGNAFSQQCQRLPRPLKASGAAAKEKAQSGVPGVTAPFIPFDEKDKIKYEDAVERAKKNDAEAFYWLAYYFLKGEGVTKDSTASGKFLQKAVDAGNAEACYLTGLYHEYYSLKDEQGQILRWSNLLTEKESEKMWDALERAEIDYGSISLQMPKADSSDDSQSHGSLRRSGLLRPGMRSDNTINCCCTNDVATGYVIGLYSTAVKGGLAYATNDIARLKLTIAKCRERIAAETEARAKSAAALDLLLDASAKGAAVAKQKEIEAKKKEDEERRRQYEKDEEAREYWSSWPAKIDADEHLQLISGVEKKFNCVFRPYDFPSDVRCQTNTWFYKKGKSLIITLDNGMPRLRPGISTRAFQKIDSEGCIVAWGGYNNRTDLEEYKWYEEEKEKRLKLSRGKWAQDRGMTLEEAIQKHKEWTESNPRPGLLRRSGGLMRRPDILRSGSENRMTGLQLARARQERRRMEEAEAAQRRRALEQAIKERELEAEERKAQHEQLRRIQEELRRQREERELRKNNNKK